MEKIHKMRKEPLLHDNCAPDAGREDLWPWAPLLLLFLSLLAFANSFPSAFIQDDIHIVQNNPLVHSLDLLRIFTSDYWYGIEYSGLYRPLTILTLALNRLLTGSAPWGFHLVNVLLHGGVTLLLWLTLSRWGLPRLAALVAAILFAVHPLHTEVLNEVVGRSELLVALFLLLALHAAPGRSRRSQGLVIFFFTLALLSKEHAIVLIALLPLFDAFTTGGWSVWRQRWPLYLGMLGIAFLWLLLRHYGVDHNGPLAQYSPTVVPLAYVPWEIRALTGLQYQWVYLAKLFVPYQLQAVYSLADLPPVLTSYWSLRSLLVVVAWCIVGVLAGWGWRRRQWWALFVLCYLASFSLTANILLPIGVTFAERLTYLPSLWFCAGLGVVLHAGLQDKRLQVLASVLLLGFFLGYTTVTVLRNRDFASEIRLWSKEVRSNPEDFLGWQSMAETLSANRRYDEADRAYRHLLQMQPDFQGGLRSYVAFLVGRERYPEAMEPASRALLLAEREKNQVGIAYDLTNLAQIYVELRQYDLALGQLARAEAKAMENRDFYFVMLGSAWEGKGEYARAIEAFARAKIYSYDRNTSLRYGRSLFKLGRLNEAKPLLEEATRLDNNAEAWLMLQQISSGQGSRPEP